MPYRIVTAPATAPISVLEAQQHLRVSGEADYLSLLIAASVDAAQAFTGRQFVPATYDAFYDEGFPSGAIELPLSPLISVASVTYVSNGIAETLASFDVDTVNARVYPAETWPQTDTIQNAVTVRFQCGYTDVPFAIRAALLLSVGGMYEHRESMSETKLHDNPAVKRLLYPYRAF